MNIIEGNLITLTEEGHFDVIVHGCNCLCTMGNGIAKEIKERCPDAYQKDFGPLWKAGYSYNCVDSYGGEDCGREYYAIYEFTKKGTKGSPKVFVKFEGWYQSYCGSEYTDWKFVEPVEKTITVYE